MLGIHQNNYHLDIKYHKQNAAIPKFTSFLKSFDYDHFTLKSYNFCVNEKMDITIICQKPQLHVLVFHP